MVEAVDGCFLPRDADQSQRLDYQHMLFIEAIGFFLHPKITANFGEAARVADVGAGTGIWVSELAQQSPSTFEFVAFDVSDAHFRTASTQSNIKFVHADGTKRFPEEFRGTFDAVHARQLSKTLEESDWSIVMRNCIELLKPGGGIQWVEPNYAVARKHVASSAENTGRVMTETWDLLFKHLGPGCLLGNERLLQAFADADLDEKEELVFAMDKRPEFRAMWTSQAIHAWPALAKAVRSMNVEDALSDEEVQRRVVLAKEEIEQGSYMPILISICVGVKPRAN